MNILVLAPLVKNGGVRDSSTYNFIEREICALAERGHDVYFFCRNKHASVAMSKVTTLVAPSSMSLIPGMLVVFLRHFGKFITPMIVDLHRTVQTLKAEVAVARFIKDCDIDIVHTHFLWPSGESCVLAAKANKTPVVATLRGAELRNNVALKDGSMRNPSFRMMFDWSKRLIGHITAPNRQLVEVLAEEHKIPRKNVTYLPNGIAPLPIDSGFVNRPCGELNLIAIGWLTPLKNHIVLLRALAKIDRKRVNLTIIGSGYLETALRAFIKRSDLSNVMIIENMPRLEMLRKLSSADCLVHPSLEEGMPNVVLEALALGIPSIASDISAHQDLVRHGYTGYRFQPEDSTELATLLNSMVGMRNRLSSLYPNCLKTAERFSLENKLIGYERIYRNLKTEMLGAVS